MKRTSLAVGSFDNYGKTTRRAIFLSEMGHVVPWQALYSLIEQHYPKAGNSRRPIGLEQMYLLQQRFNLSDPAVEEALYESMSMLSCRD